MAVLKGTPLRLAKPGNDARNVKKDMPNLSANNTAESDLKDLLGSALQGSAGMPLSLFGITANPFDELVGKYFNLRSIANRLCLHAERATSEKLTSPNWGLILDVCDRVNNGDAQTASDCALCLRKRLNHRDPHVVALALCLIDSCVNNCGQKFKSEVCSKEFVAELLAKATGSNRAVADRVRSLIRRWSQETGSDGSMEPIQSLYSELKREGYEFPAPKEKKKGSGAFDINAFKQEEEDLAKAIQLSLKDQQVTTNQASVQKLNTISSESTVRTTVKALYDFEAVEDNELSFQAGEYITLIDDSDPNWWRGSSHRGDGLFPASFVTRDLGAFVERQSGFPEENKKSVSFDENVFVASIQPEKAVEIDEVATKQLSPFFNLSFAKLDKCLIMLQETDPTGERPDPPELLQLERKQFHSSLVVRLLLYLSLGECHAMSDLIDKELSEIDQQHNRLTEANVRLMDAMNLYDFAMSESSMPVTHVATQGQYSSSIGPVRQEMLPQGNFATVDNVGVAQQNLPG
ncbi:VHS and SH3 9 domain containing protein [Trichuris trichiura]|uniref:VHS and SH3 9 domain containing protein n=1 Tax=Trichuris trichiura TaxID=36087 RepID=A0A077YYU3_TRITR|nr:VHS and SH3 9 domain containing protein [Trichuris trichiura]